MRGPGQKKKKKKMNWTVVRALRPKHMCCCAAPEYSNVDLRTCKVKESNYSARDYYSTFESSEIENDWLPTCLLTGWQLMQLLNVKKQAKAALSMGLFKKADAGADATNRLTYCMSNTGIVMRSGVGGIGEFHQLLFDVFNTVSMLALAIAGTSDL